MLEAALRLKLAQEWDRVGDVSIADKESASKTFSSGRVLFWHRCWWSEPIFIIMTRVVCPWLQHGTMSQSVHQNKSFRGEWCTRVDTENHSLPFNGSPTVLSVSPRLTRLLTCCRTELTWSSQKTYMLYICDLAWRTQKFRIWETLVYPLQLPRRGMVRSHGTHVQWVGRSFFLETKSTTEGSWTFSTNHLSPLYTRRRGSWLHCRTLVWIFSENVFCASWWHSPYIHWTKH